MSRHAHLLASLLFAALVVAKFSPQTGLTSLIRFGETWQDRRHSALKSLPIATVPGSSGYDGQFYAQIALDPLLRSLELERVIDAPVYRARRILTPATAALLGLGNPWWTLQAYALLNVLCWFALGWLLRDCIGTSDWTSFARWAGCMFSMGVLDSVRQSLVDVPALLLLALAVHSWNQARQTKTTLWLALGNLAKETNLLGTVALQAEGLRHKNRRGPALAAVLLAAIPLGLWSIYVHQRLGNTTAGEGFENFTWPLLGMYTQAKLCLGEILQGHSDGRYTFGLLALLGLTTQAVVLWRKPQFQSTWWRIGAAYSLLLPFLGLWVWSGYWAACRAVLPLTIAFNLLLPRNRAFWPLWIVGNLTLLHAIWRFL
jgi:hypothetical protein